MTLCRKQVFIIFDWTFVFWQDLYRYYSRYERCTL